MSATPVVEFKHVTKKFVFEPDRNLSIKSAVIHAITRKHRADKQYYTALNDVSFTINRGDFVGLLGRNGAGKSTSLKLIAGVLAPTSGTIQVNGRIAPLIELGAGLHPYLTGYENIFLNASIIGLSKKETQRVSDAIMEFSGLGDFMYVPVQQYSSGMFLRLGFSVAVHSSPDLLLVDEVLAVGDEGFQSRCHDKIQKLHKSGTTIVLVSHNRSDIERHCTRCLYFEKSQLKFDGSSKEALDLLSADLHA